MRMMTSRALDLVWKVTFRVADVVEVIGARGGIILVIVALVVKAFAVRALTEMGVQW